MQSDRPLPKNSAMNAEEASNIILSDYVTKLGKKSYAEEEVIPLIQGLQILLEAKPKLDEKKLREYLRLLEENRNCAKKLAEGLRELHQNGKDTPLSVAELVSQYRMIYSPLPVQDLSEDEPSTPVMDKCSDDVYFTLDNVKDLRLSKAEIDSMRKTLSEAKINPRTIEEKYLPFLREQQEKANPLCEAIAAFHIARIEESSIPACIFLLLTHPKHIKNISLAIAHLSKELAIDRTTMEEKYFPCFQKNPAEAYEMAQIIVIISNQHKATAPQASSQEVKEQKSHASLLGPATGKILGFLERNRPAATEPVSAPTRQENTGPSIVKKL
jgi:hypothetical protein